MLLSAPLFLLLGAATHASAWANTAGQVVLVNQASVGDYVTREGPIALKGVLDNIGPSGPKSRGAKAGIVVASPSKADPDYVFAWIRDSALAVKILIDRYADGRDPDRIGLIEQFVGSQATLQDLDNLSGAARDAGLGEPKFNINETPYTESWGRPQRDGPALRATALITLANYFLSQKNASYVTDTLWPMITLDLNYVARYWNQTSFDLWEEINSSSFFTTAVQHRSLREGIALANKLKDSENVDSWTKEATNCLCFLQSYWTGTFLRANTGGNRSGLDVNTILASVHTYSSNAGCDAKTFQPCSDKALAAHKALVDSFRGNLYTINSGTPSNAAVAIGRYKEDVYYGGNPWYLATFAAAEQMYLALNTWTAEKSLTVTSVSQPFFAQFLPGVAPGTYASTAKEYITLVSVIETYADGFIAINQRYTPSSGALAEQFTRSNGSPFSAADLTWSYASSLTAFDRRAGVLPAPWPATNLTVAPTCPSGPATGISSVTFSVKAQTRPGENIYLAGSIAELADWNPAAAPGPLQNPNYPIWYITLSVPADTHAEYKYIRKEGDSIKWENDPGRSFKSPRAGGSLTLNDVWR